MSALNRDELIEACRVLFCLAGENLILPPLIRNAGDALATSGYSYYCAAGEKCVRVDVEFDRAYVDRNQFPLRRLPLQIGCALCDLDYRELPGELTAEERFSLIGAFFLGSQAPIAVEANSGARDYKLSVQLSPTFFMEWREPVAESDGVTAESLCRRVGASLYEKSQEFFGSREAGIAVWSLRAAQELLGAPRLTPEALWPFIAFGFGGAFGASEAALAETTEAEAAPSAPAAGASLSVPVANVAPIAPLAPAEPATPLARRGAPPLVLRHPRGVAAALLVGAALCASWKPSAEPTRTATRVAEPAAVPAAIVTAALSSDAAPGSVATVASILEAAPSAASDSAESWPLAAPAPRIQASARAKLGAASKKALPPKTLAARGDETAIDRAAPIERPIARKRRAADPLQAVGREMRHAANALFKGLRSIPKTFEKLTN